MPGIIISYLYGTCVLGNISRHDSCELVELVMRTDLDLGGSYPVSL